LTTNIDLYVTDNGMTDRFTISKTKCSYWGTVGICEVVIKINSVVKSRKFKLKEDLVDEVTVSRDGACYSFTEVGFSAENLFNRFYSEVSVASVYDFPESDLRVTGKVDVLSSVSYELHESTSHYIFL
jgi:hypothetical protein